VLLSHSTHALAQKQSLSIQDVLTRLRANIEASTAPLPDVFCDEHIDLSLLHNGKVKHKTRIDNTIEAHRQIGEAQDFSEDRTLRLIDGKPLINGKKYNQPMVVDAELGSTFKTLISSKYESCSVYSLETTAALDGNIVKLVVSLKPDYKGYAVCSKFAAVNAVAVFWLDPATLNLQRFEMIEPVVNNLNRFHVSTLMIDYAFIQLGPQSYSLPVKVHATATKLLGSNQSDQLVYDATLSNYHKFGTTVNIIFDPDDQPH